MINRPSISYALLACNEHEELKTLLSSVIKYINDTDEIVIVTDKGNTTPEVLELINFYHVSYFDIKHYERELNQDFASQKNYLFEQCSKDYIFHIDPDELPHEFLFENLHVIIKNNPQVQIYWLPRINIVQDITMDYVRQMGWVLDEFKRINWPDYQQRIIKNHCNIKWQGKVHERLTNFQNYAYLPQDERFSLYHIKHINKQIKQNNFYNQINGTK